MSLDGFGDVLDSRISKQACQTSLSNFSCRLVKLQLQCRGESDGSPVSCLGGLVACVSQADLPDLDPGASENSNGSLTLVVLGWFVCLTWTCFCVTEGVALGKLAIKADKGRLNLLTSINRKT